MSNMKLSFKCCNGNPQWVITAHCLVYGTLEGTIHRCGSVGVGDNRGGKQAAEAFVKVHSSNGGSWLLSVFNTVQRAALCQGALGLGALQQYPPPLSLHSPLTPNPIQTPTPESIIGNDNYFQLMNTCFPSFGFFSKILHRQTLINVKEINMSLSTQYYTPRVKCFRPLFFFSRSLQTWL